MVRGSSVLADAELKARKFDQELRQPKAVGNGWSQIVSLGLQI
jgi:hypothetical protein